MSSENALPTLVGYSRAVASAVLALSVVVLGGWLLDRPALVTFGIGENAMQVNTALSFAALALLVLIPKPSVRRALLVAPVALTTLALIEFVSGRPSRLNHLLPRDPGRATEHLITTMAPATALSLIGITVAIIFALQRIALVAEVALAAPYVLSAIAIVGYLYDVDSFYRLASLSHVALHTAVLGFLLTTAVSGLVPGGVLPWSARGLGPGAMIMRRTAPVIILGLILLGYIRMRLGDAGWFGEHFGIALTVMAGVTISVSALLTGARMLDRSDRSRLAAEQSLRELNASLTEGRDEAWRRAEQLQAALITERDRLDRSVANTDSVVWSTERFGDLTTPIFLSSNAGRVLGAEPGYGEHLLQALTRMVAPKDAARLARLCDRLDRGIACEAELELASTGEPTWVTVRGVPRWDGDRLICDGILTDTTAQHLIAEQREQLLAEERLHVARLSHLNQVRDEFIALAGHELRTPVTVILGFLELLVDPDLDADQRADAFDAITRRTHQLSHLIERVFDLAKIDAGSLDLSPRPIGVARFIAEIVQGHQPMADDAGVTLTMRTVDAYVLADRARLTQIFDNLYSNAFKYVPAGGRVDIAVTADDRTVTFVVADDGPGVSPEELPYLFDRLFRSKSASSSNAPGTGLGLAVTKSLVQAHGGTLAVAANEPHGLVFTLTLARVPAPG